ncbi:hypothetical protein L842_2778 [Mycobacterium intracellulare MIN_052511_1280]|nr:hypothetical protein L842_2778 [Mycobacterium intracellulare MIN_052511_1280]
MEPVPAPNADPENFSVEGRVGAAPVQHMEYTYAPPANLMNSI